MTRKRKDYRELKVSSFSGYGYKSAPMLRIQGLWLEELGFNIGDGLSMREKEVEQKLVKAVKARGGICPKWVSPGFDGMPDRIVFLPGRHIGFVEVKAPGEKPRALQKSRHRLLEKMGFHTYILDGIEQIGGILDEIQST